MRDHGATTLIESWALTDQNSWNHPMFGSVSEWFYRGLAGINPADDAYGMNRLVLRPYFAPGLGGVSASYHSIRGRILSEWDRRDSGVSWTVSIPPNVRAEVYVPAAANERVYADGRLLDGAAWKDGFYRLAIVSGMHGFRVVPAGSSITNPGP